MEETAAGMHYSGILVRAKADDFPSCIEQLERIPGVEVHFCYPDSGRLIAVLETASAGEQEEGLRRMQLSPRVLQAAFVHHRIDADAEGPELEFNPAGN